MTNSGGGVPSLFGEAHHCFVKHNVSQKKRIHKLKQ